MVKKWGIEGGNLGAAWMGSTRSSRSQGKNLESACVIAQEGEHNVDQAKLSTFTCSRLSSQACSISSFLFPILQMFPIEYLETPEPYGSDPSMLYFAYLFPI